MNERRSRASPTLFRFTWQTVLRVNHGFCCYVCFYNIYLSSAAPICDRDPILKLSNKINTSIDQEILPGTPGWLFLSGRRASLGSALYSLSQTLRTGCRGSFVISLASQKCIKVSIPSSLTTLTLSLSHPQTNRFGSLSQLVKAAIHSVLRCPELNFIHLYQFLILILFFFL